MPSFHLGFYFVKRIPWHFAITHQSSVRESEEAPVERITSTYMGFWIFSVYKCWRWEDNTELFGSGTTLIHHLTGLYKTKGKHRETWIGTNVYMLAANKLSWNWYMWWWIIATAKTFRQNMIYLLIFIYWYQHYIRICPSSLSW